MTGRPVPRRHWRSYGDDPLPTSREALNEPFSAFPSWFMRITCDRCGKDQMKHRATEAFRAVERRVRDNVVCAPITGKEVMIGLAEAAVVQIRANDLHPVRPSTSVIEPSPQAHSQMSPANRSLSMSAYVAQGGVGEKSGPSRSADRFVVGLNPPLRL